MALALGATGCVTTTERPLRVGATVRQELGEETARLVVYLDVAHPTEVTIVRERWCSVWSVTRQHHAVEAVTEPSLFTMLGAYTVGALGVYGMGAGVMDHEDGVVALGALAVGGAVVVPLLFEDTSTRPLPSLVATGPARAMLCGSRPAVGVRVAVDGGTEVVTDRHGAAAFESPIDPARLHVDGVDPDEVRGIPVPVPVPRMPAALPDGEAPGTP